ncbi:hypothetical protein PUR29_35270 [Methylobacterium ajmalii]|jgi:hypothetical protein|uniref:Uncharacterized protein n=1 Tax=Methylobacterium ajmalii TaxID=2738439 RepID=A0ABV0A5E8_9HYPH|nr:hypothetical protein [uncultured Methylobacterium sp.]
MIDVNTLSEFPAAIEQDEIPVSNDTNNAELEVRDLTTDEVAAVFGAHHA